jgi:hypothetical protein
MANAAMIEVGSLIMINCIVRDTNCLALHKMNKMRNQFEQMINGRKTRKTSLKSGRGSDPDRPPFRPVLRSPRSAPDA